MKNKIIELLKKEGGLSTYQIAKKLKIGWSSAKLQLLDLYTQNKVVLKKEKSKGGLGYKVVWEVKEQ